MIPTRADLWRLIDVDGDAAELGVAEGRFSEEILDWPWVFPRVYLVDRWSTVIEQKGDGGFPQDWHDANFRMMQERVARFGDRAVVLRGDSAEMAAHVPDRSLALLYIDCEHTYKGVKEDLGAWVPKVAQGGIIAFHDYQNPDYTVRPAVDEFAAAHGLPVEPIPEEMIVDAGAYVRWPN